MKATLTVLGSGTSMGVPTIGCDCAVCHSSDPHDRRTRPSVLVEYDGRVVLIDSTPDFYQQAIRERITHLDAVLYTHAHADHILGIDDLRPLSFRHKPHPTHSTVENSLKIVERLRPQHAFFTHICHDLPHEQTNATLPPDVRLSYDGMKLEFEI